MHSRLRLDRCVHVSPKHLRQIQLEDEVALEVTVNAGTMHDMVSPPVAYSPFKFGS